MRSVVVRAVALGAVAAGMVAYACAAAAAVVAQAGGRTLDVHVGPLALVAVQRLAAGTATTFGSGLLAVALLGGIVNALLAVALSRRRRGIP